MLGVVLKSNDESWKPSGIIFYIPGIITHYCLSTVHFKPYYAVFQLMMAPEQYILLQGS